MNDELRKAVKKALAAAPLRAKRVHRYYLFADAKPSEAIQKHELPGLSVACLLAIKDGEDPLSVPVKQYKDYKPRNRVKRARELIDWLAKERKEDLIIAGFSLASKQKAAARYGLNLVEELPDTRVEPHHNSFRLFFGDEAIDFAQAIALVYYNFMLSFAVLRASNHAPEGYKNFVIFMDRFPGANVGNLEPGQEAPVTPGMKFIQFIRKRSRTSIEIDKDNAESGIQYVSTTLDWWRGSPDAVYIPGKERPHFALTDWYVASALAHEFEEEFIADYPDKRTAEATAQTLRDLYAEYKKFNIWSVGNDELLEHIVASEKLWTVSEEAREFIMNRAER